MNAKKGFTLVEIMIVVAIIAILAAIAIPNFIAYRKTSQMNACIANLKQLESATEAWRIKESKTETDFPTMSQLVGTSGQGFIKQSLKCPADNADYTEGADSNGNKIWKCATYSNATDYKHSIPGVTVATDK